MNFSEDHDQTWALLRDIAEPDDLAVLVDYITDKGEGRAALDSDVKTMLVTAKKNRYYAEHVRSKIDDEIREFGGNSLANAFRSLKGNGPISYKEVATDVAKRLKAPITESMSVVEIETAILQKILRDSIDKMTEEERKALLEALNVTDFSLAGPALTAMLLKAGQLGGFKTFQLAMIVANAVAKAVTGSGLKFAAGPVINKTLSIAMGPIGWVITGLWTAFDLASPALRVTLPCVVQVAYIRQKAIAALMENRCAKCDQDNAPQAKFCGACGSELNGPAHARAA